MEHTMLEPTAHPYERSARADVARTRPPDLRAGGKLERGRTLLPSSMKHHKRGRDR